MVAFKGLCTRVLSVMPRELVTPCKTPLAPFPRALVRLLTCRGEERTVSVAARLLSTQLASPVSSHFTSVPLGQVSPSHNSWPVWDENNLGLVTHCTEDGSSPNFTAAKIPAQPYFPLLTEPVNYSSKKPSEHPQMLVLQCGWTLIFSQLFSSLCPCQINYCGTCKWLY